MIAEFLDKGLIPKIRQLPVPAGMEIVDVPRRVTQLLPLAAELLVSAGDTVVCGTPLCSNPRYGMFASISGRISRIMPWDGGPRGRFRAVVIESEEVQGDFRLFDPVVDPLSILPQTLRERCQMCGFHFSPDDSPLLFTALDEDIDRVINRWFIEREFERVVSALIFLRHICENRKLVIALPDTVSVEKRDQCSQYGEVITVPCFYPDTRSDLVIRRHSWLNRSARVAVIECRRMMALLTAITTGKAVTTMQVSVRIGRKGKIRLFRMAAGMTIEQVLSICNVAVTDGMQIVMGGEMNGTAVENVLAPLDPQIDSILVLRPQEVLRSVNRPCINCGRCHRVCPVRLRVDLICRNVEFSIGKEAVRLGIDRCIDCGMCTAVCIVRRPLAHMMAFGKKAFLRQESAGSGGET